MPYQYNSTPFKPHVNALFLAAKQLIDFVNDNPELKDFLNYSFGANNLIDCFKASIRPDSLDKAMDIFNDITDIISQKIIEFLQKTKHGSFDFMAYSINSNLKLNKLKKIRKT